ncbi:hypothetical protein KVR01_004701 [Diaporthe batatas]|uniref:uncharacterized protein n=1 Tax=Diaporthe batatas TaxID=748121 RepID=UPI001D056614|nr:uncharacterized protein KVR01_004701 [Diaporthe batatas]KAG8166149.1 hypothetical protein KVR01_004701 [Diaporthe batatas]
MSRKNKKKCTKKQAQRQSRIQDAVISVLHTPNHRVYKTLEDWQNRHNVDASSQDQDTAVETKQDQNNVAPEQTQYTTPKTSNKTLKNPQTSNKNQKDNKQDQNNGDNGVRDQKDEQDRQDNQSDNQDKSDTQENNREDKNLQGNQNKPEKPKKPKKQVLQDKPRKPEKQDKQDDSPRKLQEDLAETNSQDELWGEDRTTGFYINTSVTEKQAVAIALKATQADFDPANRIFFTYGASVPEKMTRLALGNKKNNYQGRKRMAGAAAICKQPSTENNRVSWHGKQWTLGYSETTSGADAELVAISGCLSVAAKELGPAKDNKTAPPKVTIITHDQDATDKIAEVLHWDPKTQRHPEATEALVEIVQKARSLSQDVGAVIELLCINKNAVRLRVRGQSGPVIMRGNQYAENAAWKAAMTPDMKLPSCSQMSTLN